MASTYTTPCVDCGEVISLTRKPPRAGMSCGSRECLAKHNARATDARREGARQASATRRTRAASPRRSVMVGDGSWQFVAALNGLAADGTRAR